MFSLELVSFICISFLGSFHIAVGAYSNRTLEELCPTKSLGPLGKNNLSSIELFSGKNNGAFNFDGCSLTLTAAKNEGFVFSVHDSRLTANRTFPANMTINGKVYTFTNKTTVGKNDIFETNGTTNLQFKSAGGKVQFNMTITKISYANCSHPGMFNCSKTSCIWSGLKCDGHVNCPDKLDELKGKGGGCGAAGRISGSGISAIIITAVVYISTKAF